MRNLILLVVILGFTSSCYSQNQEYKLKKYSFGTAWNIKNNNDVIGDEGVKYDTIGIVYTDGNYYARNKKFGSQEFYKLITSKNLKAISLDEPELVNGVTNIFNIEKTDTIFSYLWLRDLKIHSFLHAAYLQNLVFRSGIIIGGGKILGQVEMYSNKFNNEVRLAGIEFHKFIRDSSFRVYDTDVRFWGNTFRGSTTFDLCKFFTNVYFSNSLFNNVNFRESSFYKVIKFSDIVFNGYVSFRGVSFTEKPGFNRVIFKDTLNLIGSKFNEGVDFRRADFDSLRAIFLENMYYPIGELYISWEQIKYRARPLIQVDSISSSKIDDYKRLENIYLKLSDNYLAQGNKNSSDDVKYELELRKDELLNNLDHKIYGVIFGYGYQPLRYISLAVIIMLIFSFIFYYNYYNIYFEILDKKFDKGKNVIIRLKKKKIPFYFEVNKWNVKNEEYYNRINLLTVAWHSLIFSTSILLGLRFKKEWINRYNKKFLMLVSMEWVVGLALYVGFIWGVKNARFDFIKGLLGI